MNDMDGEIIDAIETQKYIQITKCEAWNNNLISHESLNLTNFLLPFSLPKYVHKYDSV
jgi:hypothetical protein